MRNMSATQSNSSLSDLSLSLITSQDSLQTLNRLCNLVISCERPYEDVAEMIEDKAYELCEEGKLEEILRQLKNVADFFERLGNKSEEQCRDLADVYLLTGQIYQYAEKFPESIPWFKRASVVDDRYSAAFHSMATSYAHMHEYDAAIKSLEQEIILSPGNYYSYLLLSDLYEGEGRLEDVEECLKQLLVRDPDNIQGLHRLIRHYTNYNSRIETTLLERRLMGINKEFNRMEAIIRSYYLCYYKRYDEVVAFLDKWHSGSNGVTITMLVKAYVMGELRLYRKRRQAISDFRMVNNGREDVMKSKLKEFGAIFGDKAAERLRKVLFLSPRKKK